VEKEYITEKIREYYRGGIVPPVEIEKREFGIGNFDKKIVTRHIAFKNMNELHSFLIQEAPIYISHSVSYYEYPDGRPMEKKQWLGADLVFDLDADDVPCGKKHIEKWFCTDCLENVKYETLKLIDLLTDDLGINKKDLKIVFSGNKGYHIHIRTPEVKRLDQDARKEIVEYIRMDNPSEIDLRRGVGKKIAKILLKKLKEGNIDISGRRKITKPELIQMLESGKQIALPKGVIEKAVRFVSSHIDRSVTFDLSKLIRMPDSIHGSSGLKVCYLSNLDKFDPFRDAVIFGNAKVKIRANAPEFTLKDQTFGPFKNKETTLPEYAAIYLILKGRGTLRGL
jgi:DNA primase small subunit